MTTSKDFVADVQSYPDKRRLPIERVGICRLRHPIIFEEFQGAFARQNTIAHFDMLVNLAADRRGTHMSRFSALLNEKTVVLSLATLPTWVKHMTNCLEANQGYLKAQFPFFLKKSAPLSKVKSLMNYEVSLQAILTPQKITCFVILVIPVTSLCPCSKEIADYGAHNQRSHVTLTLEVNAPFSLTHIIQLVEKQASCELYGLLKRVDEKVVTERAYDNPKFVEDMVRDIATELETQTAIKAYKVSSENFESIHNHSAYAEIDRLNLTPYQTHCLEKKAACQHESAYL